MKNKTYIVAGCRPWNKWAVEKMQRKLDGAVVSVSTPEELIDKSNFYLNNEKLRKQIISAGFKNATAIESTYLYRVQTILKKINN